MNAHLVEPRQSALRPLKAVAARELHAAILNRYLQLFCLLALGGGIGAALVTRTPDAAPMLILQMTLYFVSLFALLVGTSSARAESEEWPLLFAQPIPRSAFLFGKFIALTLLFAAVLALLFLPALFVRQADVTSLLFYGQTLALAAGFVALGLAAGFFARDRVQGLILGVSIWLFLLFGMDLVALLITRFGLLQRWPDIWSALLMSNPLDAFRINALFALERIPAEAAKQTPLTNWWLAHTSLWLFAISLAWMAALLSFTARRLKHWED